MKYKFHGSEITRTTIGKKDITLVPGQPVDIEDVEKNAYVKDLIEQKLLTPVEKKA